MLKTLLKKQMAEIFRNYFYDPKKNKMRSRGATIAYIALYALLMVGLLGGMFALLAVGICAPMAAAMSFAGAGSRANAAAAVHSSTPAAMGRAFPGPVGAVMDSACCRS